MSVAGDGASGLALHDVMRDHLRSELGPPRTAALACLLLDAVAAGLPVADPLDGTPGSPVTAWWALSRENRYLCDHLIEHLLEAGRQVEAEAVVGDLRWLAARVRDFGPAAAAADLFLVGTPSAARREAALARVAHLMAPTEPADAVVDILISRLALDPDWGSQVPVLCDLGYRPRLANRRPPPDLPAPALRRVMAGPGAAAPGDRAGWPLARHWRLGRGGADLGCRHRADPGHPHRPHGSGERRGDRAGWLLVGQRE